MRFCEPISNTIVDCKWCKSLLVLFYHLLIIIHLAILRFIPMFHRCWQIPIAEKKYRGSPTAGAVRLPPPDGTCSHPSEHGWHLSTALLVGWYQEDQWHAPLNGKDGKEDNQLDTMMKVWATIVYNNEGQNKQLWDMGMAQWTLTPGHPQSPTWLQGW